MARPSAETRAAASYKSDDDFRRRNGGGGQLTSPFNPHLQSGQEKRGIGCLKSRTQNPPSTVPTLSPKHQVTGSTSPKSQVTSQTKSSNPLRRSRSVGDWQRKYLFLEDPEARGGERQEEGARDSFVEQQPVTGRTFDPLALREGDILCSNLAVLLP